MLRRIFRKSRVQDNTPVSAYKLVAEITQSHEAFVDWFNRLCNEVLLGDEIAWATEEERLEEWRSRTVEDWGFGVWV